MSALGPARFSNAESVVDALLDRVGKKILLGLPLGLGKANLFANALFARAFADPSISLHIFTALTLERPRAHSELEERFLQPFVERVFGDYPELAYAQALREGNVPANIRVSEFFLQPGAWLAVQKAQQEYICTNYTHVVRDLVDAGCNVIAQLVDRRHIDGVERFSLSCNPELTLDTLEIMRKNAAQSGKAVALVGEINETLPFMFNDAEVGAEYFDLILDPPKPYFQLFSLPHQSVDLVDYAAGLHAASLVEDGGTLQIGIGSLSDAIAHFLILRHRNPDSYRALLAAVPTQTPHLPRQTKPFVEGLYGGSEMVVDPFLDLIEAGVLKRKVYPDLEVERERARAHEAGREPAALAAAMQKKGVILHAGFFVGSRAFYKKMKNLPDEIRHQIDMTRISYVNQLYGDEELKRLQRRKARFINTALMVTLNGAAVSDGLEDGRVISGVGGQYNFVSMAHELKDARAILAVRATRVNDGVLQSNIRWSYGHCTIPRHLRDIVVNEYGIADLRGRSDQDCIKALLDIADSRFQEELLATAKKAGKISQDYVIPDAWRANLPERLKRELGPSQGKNLLPAFPFGSDFTDEEIRLGTALKWLKAHTQTKKESILLTTRALALGRLHQEHEPLLRRMGFDRAQSPKERLYRRLLSYALQQTDTPKPTDAKS